MNAKKAPSAMLDASIMIKFEMVREGFEPLTDQPTHLDEYLTRIIETLGFEPRSTAPSESCHTTACNTSLVLDQCVSYTLNVAIFSS